MRHENAGWTWKILEEKEESLRNSAQLRRELEMEEEKWDWSRSLTGPTRAHRRARREKWRRMSGKCKPHDFEMNGSRWRISPRMNSEIMQCTEFSEHCHLLRWAQSIYWLIDGSCSFISLIFGWSIDWLIDWSTDWLIDWLIDWLMFIHLRCVVWLGYHGYVSWLSSLILGLLIAILINFRLTLGYFCLIFLRCREARRVATSFTSTWIGHFTRRGRVSIAASSRWLF